jgi:hypothetical protein
MAQRMRAVCRICGCRVSRASPLTSRRKRSLAPPRRPSSATKSTTIPIPPRKWVKLRQKRIHRGTKGLAPSEGTSKFFSTLAPVVVKPDMDSKKESANPMGVPALRCVPDR